MTERLLQSQVPAVLTAFAAQLAARPAFAAARIPVDLGWPAGGPQPNHCWIDGSVEDWTEEWLTTIQADGPVPKTETFTITGNLLTTIAGGAKPDAFAALMTSAFGLAGEIDRQVQDDFTIAGTVNTARVVGGDFNEEPVAGEDGSRRVLITRRVLVETDWPRTDG